MRRLLSKAIRGLVDLGSAGEKADRGEHEGPRVAGLLVRLSQLGDRGCFDSMEEGVAGGVRGFRAGAAKGARQSASATTVAQAEEAAPSAQDAVRSGGREASRTWQPAMSGDAGHAGGLAGLTWARQRRRAGQGRGHQPG